MYNLPIIVALQVGMVKKIKAEWLAVNQSKILINFAWGGQKFSQSGLVGGFRFALGKLNAN